MNSAWKGLAGGMGLILILSGISTLSLEAYLWEKDPRSLLSAGSGSGQMDLLRESISDVSLSATGRPDSIQGTVTADRSALRWSVRDFQGLEFAPAFDTEQPPPLLITTPEDAVLVENLGSYRGQDFVISSHPGWEGILPDDWISWIGFRRGPIEREYIILWIRNDINSGY